MIYIVFFKEILMTVLLIQMLVNTSVIHIMILIIVHVILAIDSPVMVEHVMVSYLKILMLKLSFFHRN